MRTTNQFSNSLLPQFEVAFMSFSLIDPIGNNPGTDDGGRVRVPPRVPSLDEVTPGQYFPEDSEGPDPTEEEQRERDDLDHIDPDHDKSPENPDHQQDDIYNPKIDRDEDVEEKGL